MKVVITLSKSSIGCSKKQKNTLKALGLGKTNRSVEKEATPQIMGMIEKVKHLVTVNKTQRK